MKKIKRLSFFYQTLAAMLGLFSVSRASAENLLKKIRWVPPRLANRNHKTSSQNSEPLAFRLGPVANPFDAHQLDDESLKRAGAIGESVTRRVQKIEGVAIRGTWVQSISNLQGEKVFEAGEILDSVPEELRAHVKEMYARKSEALAAFEKSTPGLLRASWSSDPQLEVIMNPKLPFALEWTLDFMSEDETAIYRAVLDEQFKFKGVKNIGFRMEEGLGAVYPRGPKGSTLEVKPLSDLDGSGRLTSDDIFVKTGLKDEAVSKDLDFRFDPRDNRFDQVQAYFFATQAIKFFKTAFDASPLTQIELKVQVGDHSNAAFYYSNRIRLGTGDGVKYNNMAQDPSVVMHEVGHAFVDRYAGLPSDGEGGSLNEAFADYFAANILDNPRLGESSFLAGPYVRTLENNFTAPGDLNSGVYKASQVVSGSLWDLRLALGAEMTNQLAFRTLSRLGSGATLKDFAPSVMLAADSMNVSPEQKSKTVEILRARGWEY